MGEIADELIDKIATGDGDLMQDIVSSSFIGKFSNPNWLWTDRFGKTQSFMDMNGFHLWNIKVFILRSGKRGLLNRLPYIDSALKAKSYGVEEYRKDCEKLSNEETK